MPKEIHKVISLFTDEDEELVYDYCIRHFELDGTSKMLVRNIIHQAAPLRNELLRESYFMNYLEPIGVSPRECKLFAGGKVPQDMMNVPVYANVTRGVKTWVLVPVGATDDEIKEAAIENIMKEDYDLDDSLDIERDDISIYEIDHAGEYEE